MSNVGRLFSSVWVLFCLVIVSVYTANLAAFLTQRTIEGQIDTIEGLIKNERTACTMAGTAYNNFLQTSPTYANLRIEEKTDIESMQKAVVEGECEVLIVSTTIGDYVARSTYPKVDGSCLLTVRGDPVIAGPTYLAIGVRNDWEQLRHLLSLEVTDQQFTG
jgi:hypothetical protein